MTNSLIIKNLYTTVSDKEIIKGLNLTIKSGETHAIMGPNGSGKSTLAYVIAGHPSYKISNGKCQISNKDITKLKPEERAKMGIFLAFQNPIAIPGVRVSQLLKTAYKSLNRKKISPLELYRLIEKKAQILGIDKSFLERGVNDGFSGGEKKKLEMLQLLILEPSFIIIDEIDTGLDVDSLKIVAQTLNSLKMSRPKDDKPGILIISHYQRIFNYIKPDYVHILKKGKIIKTGDYKLVEKVEKEGYARFTN